MNSNPPPPIPFERQDPRGAETLQNLYQCGGTLQAYFWQRGHRSGVGRSPRLPNHTSIALLPDGRIVHLV